ncbi:PREDICTED: N-acetylmuramoyl-L-alanine amidase [Dipodomys ordii]|uniref:N-acetylmuramoyl-L-alanine amidase n=1 Tax=Dipodomys ordii TaxID=10020 RepID=A0A1S3G4J5_DIPOR|nr:PREDICTED: N-acetylmuramoyl-L-alanine amidase [Dipodomys ordii]
MAGGHLCFLLVLLLWPGGSADSLPLLMDSIIQAVAELEQKELEGGPAASVRVLLSAGPPGGLPRFLRDSVSPGASPLDPDPLGAELRALVDRVAQHEVRGRQERGVLLAPDGSTVALRPLLLGLEAGQQGRRAVPLGDGLRPPGDTGGDTLAGSRNDSANVTWVGEQAEPPAAVDSLLAAALATELGLAFLHPRPIPSPPGLGSEGCWDRLSSPQNFTLLDPPTTPLTMAFLNGALDGVLLGEHLSRLPPPRPRLSLLLGQYYGAGVDGDPGFRSNFRRQRGAALISAPNLAQQVWGALILLQSLEPRHPQLHNRSREQLAQAASYASQEFTQAFLGCAASLRAVQRFHQGVRGWDDVGYSFVVGSDGYVYEGRGWHWVGAHTRGYNFRGFGVAFIGDYTASLPTAAALRTVRDGLPRCASRAGLLRPDYKLLGHRQLRRGTDCPGDALFHLLRTWPHFIQTVN